MLKLSRREMIFSSAAAGAVLGATGRVTFLPSAIAREAADKGFYTFKVGAIEVTTVFDGVWEKPHDPAFIANATVEDTKAALKAAGQDDSKVVIPFTVTFVKMGGKTIMFDAGTGGQLSPMAGKLSANMAAAGIDPQSISTILVTHFHPDHIFGLMEKDTNAQVYPNAEIVVPEAEYKFWTDLPSQANPPEAMLPLANRVKATFPNWKNLRQFASSGEVQVLPGIVAIPAQGHTRGHTIYAVGSGKDQLMVLADLTNIPALFAKHPEWHVSFDWDAKLAEETRRKFFDRVVADKVIMTGYHYGVPGAGTMQKDGDGYAFVPIA